MPGPPQSSGCILYVLPYHYTFLVMTRKLQFSRIRFLMQAFILKHFHLENSQYNRAQNVLNCSPINFLYRRSVLIVFFNVITPLYRPAS